MLFLTTSAEVWDALEQMFASRSRARLMQVRVQLANLHKNDMQVFEYFQKVKGLANTMASIGHPLQDEKSVSYLLARLGSDYDSFVTPMVTRSDPLNLNDLYGHLLSHELRQEHNNSQQQ